MLASDSHSICTQMLRNEVWIDVECRAKELNAIAIDGLYDQNVRVLLRRGSEEARQFAGSQSGFLYKRLGAGREAPIQEKVALKVFPFTIRVVRPGENAAGLFFADQKCLSMALLEVFLKTLIK
jgi:hypothetical protein